MSLAVLARHWGGWFASPELWRGGQGGAAGGRGVAHGLSVFWPQVWAYQVYTQVECSQAQVKSQRRRGPSL